MSKRFVRRLTVAALFVGVLVAGCGGKGASSQGTKSSSELRFTADATTAPAFDPVDVRLTGLQPGAAVTITSDAVDHAKVHWHGSGQFTADASGAVDVAKQPSTAGTYTGVDETGLLWSMDPLPESDSASYFAANCTDPFTVTLTATAGKASATITLTREWRVPGVTTKALTVAADGFAGSLFLPPPGGKARPAVLAFGGSEGGDSQICRAEMLAAKGFPTLAIAYFRVNGTPATLRDVPIEYFAKAAQYLAGQPGVDRSHIIASGLSRGTEAALLLAQNYPQLIHGAIVIAPSAVVNAGYPSGPFAWTLHGTGLTKDQPIPVDKISGPVLALTGDSDQLWASFIWAPQIKKELDAVHNPFRHEALLYPNAGHDVADDPLMPVTGHLDERGGTRQGNAVAQSAVWAQTLGLLQSLSANT